MGNLYTITSLRELVVFTNKLYNNGGYNNYVHIVRMLNLLDNYQHTILTGDIMATVPLMVDDDIVVFSNMTMDDANWYIKFLSKIVIRGLQKLKDRNKVLFKASTFKDVTHHEIILMNDSSFLPTIRKYFTFDGMSCIFNDLNKSINLTFEKIKKFDTLGTDVYVKQVDYPNVSITIKGTFIDLGDMAKTLLREMKSILDQDDIRGRLESSIKDFDFDDIGGND